jgi:hypothetical protein
MAEEEVFDKILNQVTIIHPSGAFGIVFLMEMQLTDNV